MNKAWLLLLLLIVGGGSVFAQSARPDPFDKPERDLSKEFLSERDLYAYQKRANQKVEEYYQYLQVMANHLHNDPIRDKALEMAERQFEKSAEINLDPKPLSVETYLGRCRRGTQFKSLDSMYVSQPLTLQKTGHFEGKIWVRYYLMDSKKPYKKAAKGTEELTVELMKTKKRFGSVNRIVWELYLGGIETTK